MTAIENQLGTAFRQAHSTAQDELGFGMPVLMQMLTKSGPTEVARTILRQPTDMFANLFMRRRLDLSVEAIMLRSEFRPLFTADELQTATDRLRQSAYPIEEPSAPDDQEAWGQVARRARKRWAEENPF